MNCDIFLFSCVSILFVPLSKLLY